jgi:hypothetical protein
MPDFGAANAPAKKTLYLGDNNGNIRRTALLVPDTSTPPKLVLDTVANLRTALQSVTYPAELGANEPIIFLGAAVSSVDRNYYLRAQSVQRLTVLRYNSSTTNWLKRWTSYVGGGRGAGMLLLAPRLLPIPAARQPIPTTTVSWMPVASKVCRLARGSRMPPR